MLKTLLSLASVVILGGAVQAQTVYNGNGGTGFGGPVGGQGASLSFSSNGTTLTGTITAGNTGQLFDELVIYIDSQAGGFTDTSGFTDTDGGDTLHKAISGFDGTKRAVVMFPNPFAADFAIAISPTQAQFGGLYGLTAAGGTNFIGSVNLSPTNAAGPYTFSISLTNIGVQPDGSFNFATTYLNAHSDIYRSNEAFNTLTGTPADGGGNFAQNTVTLGVNTFTVVPEPSAVALGAVGLVGLLVLRQRRS